MSSSVYRDLTADLRIEVNAESPLTIEKTLWLPDDLALLKVAVHFEEDAYRGMSTILVRTEEWQASRVDWTPYEWSPAWLVPAGEVSATFYNPYFESTTATVEVVGGETRDIELTPMAVRDR